MQVGGRSTRNRSHRKPSHPQSFSKRIQRSKDEAVIVLISDGYDNCCVNSESRQYLNNSGAANFCCQLAQSLKATCTH
ncbi:hypothetical protein NC651_032398 [Populus alba x Populus x berolinensis]|nr:hypothetical protein NC651_032398 [Populus alba x Populus x berolinensis]